MNGTVPAAQTPPQTPAEAFAAMEVGLARLKLVILDISSNIPMAEEVMKANSLVFGDKSRDILVSLDTVRDHFNFGLELKSFIKQSEKWVADHKEGLKQQEAGMKEFQKTHRVGLIADVLEGKWPQTQE